MLQELPLGDVYQLLEPGPVALLTTAAQDRLNIMTLSWHMMMEFEPPRVACIVSANNHSFAALTDTLECVIALPARHLAEKVVQIGNTSGRDTDKFAAAGLTPQAAWQVGAPLIAECFANLECRVTDTRLVTDYNLFILEVVEAWTDPRQPNPKTLHHHGYGRFAVDGEEISFASKMR
ncbi:flavin reductase family protein [Methylomonas rivi]|uniref:Flavin reductase family protein n=1 Tax=Methylomonas rivi TaxID=2952226 RepID=A0ABT1U7U0_9GAMM|nr:flavin reductase family protein [Methylomonas sp. WSC-6]MCQ8129922.1 flavin reductase family protein [Methylomonas sp. WSC-6]